ncbi:MAG: hypothetical protein ACTHNU_12685 [Gaiellales bacterium]
MLESYAASLRGRGRADDARERAQEAEEIYERLGARPALDRLRAAGGEPARPSAAM